MNKCSRHDFKKEAAGIIRVETEYDIYDETPEYETDAILEKFGLVKVDEAELRAMRNPAYKYFDAS